MHVPPRVRGGLVARSVALVVGLFLFAVGIVCQLESGLGLSPWDVLHQGIAEHTPLSFGAANIVVGLVVLAVAWSLGATIGVATVANSLLVGAFVQSLTAIGAVERLADDPLGVRIALLVVAMPIYGIASALYLGAWMGAGPRDSLMVVVGARTHVRLGVVRAAIELLALAAGFALGGTVGIGTVVFALTIGPALEGGFWLLRRSPVGVPAGVSPIPAPLAGS
ncbi:MAG: YczE/YyaS/YitT family protein [Verrucomicrobiota bacterium]